MIDKRQLSEREICSKFITQAVTAAGRNALLQIREEISFTKGRIIVRGKLDVLSVFQEGTRAGN